MRITRAVVPSLFTVLNMFCGFNSILYASSGDYVSSAWLIFLAAGFDAFDGIMARLTKSSSEFGVQIDSLSDVISFGAAPAYLVFQLDLHTLGTAGILISSLLMVFGGLRLARFNSQLVGFDKDHFVGLPIPASALTVAAFVLKYGQENPVSGEYQLHHVASDFLPWLCVVLALLMVSKVKYDTLPRISKRAIKKEPWKFVFAVLAVIVVTVTGGEAMLPLFGLFIALGIVRYVGSTLKRWMHHEEKLEEEEAAEPSSLDI
jgi:CDP-diacylglycerol--serine O-phosphatidyltransferase